MSSYDAGYIMEFFDLRYGIDMIDPEEYFSEESAIRLQEEVRLLTEDATKNNVLDKIIAVIKKVGKWIKEQVQKVVDWFTKRKTKNRPIATGDQCISKVLGKAAVVAAIGAAAVGGGALLAKKFTLKTVNADQPQPNPDVQLPTVAEVTDLKYKDIILAINGDEATVSRIVDIQNNKKAEGAARASILIRDQECMGLFVKVMELVKDPTNGTVQAITEAWNAFKAKYEAAAPDKEYKFKIDDLSTFNVNFNKAIDGFDAINTSTADPRYSDQTFVNHMNAIAGIIMNIQTGVLEITNGLQKYAIDPRLENTIKDINQLDQFVAEMVRCGIPSKAIRLNVAIAADPSLLGGADTSGTTPVNGQAAASSVKYDNTVWYIHRDRCYVNTPNGEVRIAMDEKGHTMNVNELNISKALGDMMAKPVSQTANNYVTTWENLLTWGEAKSQLNLNPDGKAGANSFKQFQPQFDEFKQKVQAATTQHGIRSNIADWMSIGDRAANCGFRTGTPPTLVYKGLSGNEGVPKAGVDQRSTTDQAQQKTDGGSGGTDDATGE